MSLKSWFLFIPEFLSTQMILVKKVKQYYTFRYFGKESHAIVGERMEGKEEMVFKISEVMTIFGSIYFPLIYLFQ